MKKGLSVAHICLDRGYLPAHRQVQLLIQALLRNGVMQILVCRDDSPLAKAFDGKNNLVKVIRISGVSDPRFVGHFKLLHRVRIMHAHDVHGVNWAFIHYLMTGLPYIVTLRNPNLMVNSLFNKTMLAWAKKVVTTQARIKIEFASKFELDAEIIHDCTSNISPYKPNVETLRHTYKGRFIIGMAADLINRLYGQSTLIDAVKSLRLKIPEAVILFIGGGDDLSLLKEKATGMPNVKFVGHQKHIADYLAALDVFCYAVNEEGNVSILLDVLDLEIPVIASDVGSISEIIHDNETGLIVKARDVEELANALLRIKQDRTLVSTLRTNGKNMAHAHDAKYMATAYISVYSRVLAKD